MRHHSTFQPEDVLLPIDFHLEEVVPRNNFRYSGDGTYTDFSKRFIVFLLLGSYGGGVIRSSPMYFPG